MGRALSRDDLRLLAYSMTVKRVRAVELGPGYRREHDLCDTAELLSEYEQLHRELTSPASLSRPTLPALTEFSTGWGRKLLPPSWLADPPDVAAIVPHGFIHTLPLHLVATDSGAPLCVTSAISVNSSLTLLERCLSRSPDGNDGRIDPFLHLANRRAPTGSSARYLVAGVDALGRNDDAWRRLPIDLLALCDPRAEAIARMAETHSARDLLADALLGRAYDLAIIAAHGVQDRLDALGSGVLVRRPPTDRVAAMRVTVLGRHMDADGVPYVVQDLPTRDVPPTLDPSVPAEVLSLGELETKGHLVCPLVALMGCSTGRATIYAGDQPVSMAEMVLRIGASAVVAPMWDVKLSAVETWMRSFLAAWKVRGEPRGVAARAASRERFEAGAALHDVGCMVLRGDWR